MESHSLEPGLDSRWMRALAPHLPLLLLAQGRPAAEICTATAASSLVSETCEKLSMVRLWIPANQRATHPSTASRMPSMALPYPQTRHLIAMCLPQGTAPPFRGSKKKPPRSSPPPRSPSSLALLPFVIPNPPNPSAHPHPFPLSNTKAPCLACVRLPRLPKSPGLLPERICPYF
ncbi:hypothetical protein BDY17DRAFT_299451 [Neohortaea acidophila]|uniref:Uncharacterized protein n=1 Tax=Neohortaea acidophila TaxID=245834 RepID=A0A6A6PR40_9PEZI|nr:uncharacterized protein BDY17DRAFT_299451 [Neohortaea acidophila]KAF2481677.1 hypothetical protein BDY17DRAFT_299451 [Neohortaea acidophila]